MPAQAKVGTFACTSDACLQDFVNCGTLAGITKNRFKVAVVCPERDNTAVRTVP